MVAQIPNSVHFYSEQISPANIEAEEAVLGAILLDPVAIATATPLLPPEAFSLQAHRIIYKAAIALHEQGRPTDLVQVTTHLSDKKRLKEIGGQSKLATLVERTISTAIIGPYIDLVMEKYYVRLQRGIGSDLAAGRLSLEEAKAELEKIPTVTSDTRYPGDNHKLNTTSISRTVTIVTEVLKFGFLDFEEQARLDEIQLKSSMSKSSFWKLVASLRAQLDEVQPSDEIRLSKLIDWSNASLDFEKALPSMAKDILHDAKVLNIDPIGIWQYLLPAVLSLVGKKINLDVKSHKIPAIVWTGLVAESGSGKTRAENLVTAPLNKLQANEWERFQEDLARYEQQKEAKSKDGGSAEPLEKPVAERKYLFEVATIQAVMKRLNEQGLNGSLWARDELAGLFKSFGQFSKGEQEGLECFLKLWDGSSTQVDRVRSEDSHFTRESRLSVAGGIQPGVFRQVFKDRNDSQGIQARFLFATPQTLAPKRVDSYCILSGKLPALYDWLDNLPVGDIKLSKEADALYTHLHNEIGNQAIHTSMPAIRAWMMKLPTNMLRIALGLHLIECYHGTAQMPEISVATLERAVLFAQYYRSSFQVLQEKAVESDEISSILLKIWDLAAEWHPDGISARDAYRSIKAIQYRAKDARCPVGDYTLNLFRRLEQMGKGQLVKNGRAIKFVANLNPVPLAHIEEKVTIPVTVVTVPETTIPQGLEVSLVDELSLVTVVPDPDLPDEQSGSTELKWLLQLLADMEESASTGTVHPRFTSDDEVAKLFDKAEVIAQTCEEKMMNICPDYVGRLGRSVEVVLSLLAKPDLQPGQRVKVGSHYGHLSAKNCVGWFVTWDKLSSSEVKRIGEPPAGAIATKQIQLA